MDNSTLVTNGPGGVVNNSTLDGGNSSSHGFTASGSIPGSSTAIFSRSNPSEIVDFRYEFGMGDVYYSTIPLDFYLGGSSSFASVYAPNVVAYAAELAQSDVSVVPEPTSLAIFGVAAFGMVGFGRRRKQKQAA